MRPGHDPTDTPPPVRASEQLRDDLRLQAWLARAELRNPSLHHEVDALAQLRDQLMLQVKLGKMEAREEWEKAEGRWQRLRARLEDTAAEAGDEIKGLLADIRAAYDRMHH
ncbi:hypothetical protein L6R53_28070 [Myxococcota bacterium]|nr:hypothetical protein [Myxococcota bacterium]